MAFKTISTYFYPINLITMELDLQRYQFMSGSLLSGLPPEEFNFLKSKLEIRKIRKGTLIFAQGNTPKGCYFLRKGKVKIYQQGDNGGEQIVYFYRKGEAFGYRPILCDEPNPVSARAIEDCVISFIPREAFIATLKTSAPLANKLLLHLSHEFSVLANTMSAFKLRPAKERLALCLLILNEKYKNGHSAGYMPSINIPRSDKANYIGTTVETVVRMLNKLKSESIIATKGRKITLLRPDELARIANEAQN
jgi:CRP-like cAMP-binding protein